MLLLVQKFGYSVQAVTLLFVINNSVNYFLSPTIGRAIIRFGERRVLSMEYTALVAVFLAYAFAGSRGELPFLADWMPGILNHRGYTLERAASAGGPPRSR